MIDSYNLPQEPGLPVEAVLGFGEQHLALVAPQDGTPLAAEREEFVFTLPEGAGMLEPVVLTEFVQQFIPSGVAEPFVRGWALTAGRVESVHSHWKVGYDPHTTIAVTQLRGQIVRGIRSAVELSVHMAGVIDKAVDGIDISIGDIDAQGKFEFGATIALTSEELSGRLPPDKSRAVIDLVDGVRSVLTLAEIHVQPERQPRPPAAL
jgi:hypothetical protein